MIHEMLFMVFVLKEPPKLMKLKLILNPLDMSRRQHVIPPRSAGTKKGQTKSFRYIRLQHLIMLSFSSQLIKAQKKYLKFNKI